MHGSNSLEVVGSRPMTALEGDQMSLMVSPRELGPAWLNRDGSGRLNVPMSKASLFAIGHLIRTVELAILKMFSMGQVQGTTHTCTGQELCQMAVVRAMTHPDDHVFSNHRNHGHFLTFCGDVDGLLAEIAGRQGGVCGGYGGSQHLLAGHFHSNGVQGGMTGIGVGTALSLKRRHQDGMVAVIVGDGTLGEGLLYESLNLAGVWSAPILFVVENNRIAQTTPQSMTLSGDIASRGAAFGLDTWRVSDRDPDFFERVDSIVDQVRRESRPGFLVIDTFRLGPHSKGDDLRDEAEVAAIRQSDPLVALGQQLPSAEREEIESANQAFVTSTMTDVLARAPVRGLADWQPAPLLRQQIRAEPPHHGLTVGEAINGALRAALKRDPDLVVLGEDLHDPYGGAFKITKGLSSSFPNRVVSTPISEAGITGTAIGLAMQGWHVVVEIMFADFLTLCADQLYNHASKFPYLFDTDVALVMRSPAGGRRGYGPTHSQSPESIMAAIPGLAVVYPSHRHDCGAMLAAAIDNCRSPVVFMEHKLLYQREQNAGDFRCSRGEGAAALFPVAIRSRARPDLTIITYGGALMLAEDAAKILEEEEELEVEIIVPSLLTRAGLADAAAMVSTSQVCVFEECPGQFSIGSQIVAELLEAASHVTVRHIGALPLPIPSARTLEEDVLPSCESLVAAALDLVLNSSETEA